MQRPERREFLARLALLSAVAVIAPRPAFSQTSYGKVISGFPAGSTVDVLARLYAARLSLGGRTFIVESRVGAGGRLAAEQLRSAPADGLTVLLTPDAIMTNYPLVYRNLSYDPARDFRPVGMLAAAPHCIAVGPMVPAGVKTLADFAGWCKANPGKASFGTPGSGSPMHFIGVMFSRTIGLELTHVGYRGGMLAAQDVAGGQLASCVTVLSDALQLAQAGRIRLLAVTGKERSRFVPDVPTAAEAGFGGLESISWYGLFVPARTPDDMVTSLSDAANATARDSSVIETMSKVALEPTLGSQQDAAALLKKDSLRWAQVIKQVGYSATD